MAQIEIISDGVWNKTINKEYIIKLNVGFKILLFFKLHEASIYLSTKINMVDVDYISRKQKLEWTKRQDMVKAKNTELHRPKKNKHLQCIWHENFFKLII